MEKAEYAAEIEKSIAEGMNQANEIMTLLKDNDIKGTPASRLGLMVVLSNFCQGTGMTYSQFMQIFTEIWIKGRLAEMHSAKLKQAILAKILDGIPVAIGANEAIGDGNEVIFNNDDDEQVN